MSAVIAFAAPLMFQILIDKVITHHSTETLFTLELMFGVLTVFDGVFSYVRQYLITVITSKVDAGLASRTFAHLLTLPLPFFERTTTGVLARNLQQTDTIRQFLTGRLFQTLAGCGVLAADGGRAAAIQREADGGGAGVHGGDGGGDRADAAELPAAAGAAVCGGGGAAGAPGGDDPRGADGEVPGAGAGAAGGVERGG